MPATPHEEAVTSILSLVSDPEKLRVRLKELVDARVAAEEAQANVEKARLEAQADLTKAQEAMNQSQGMIAAHRQEQKEGLADLKAQRDQVAANIAEVLKHKEDTDKREQELIQWESDILSREKAVKAAEAKNKSDAEDIAKQKLDLQRRLEHLTAATA